MTGNFIFFVVYFVVCIVISGLFSFYKSDDSEIFRVLLIICLVLLIPFSIVFCWGFFLHKRLFKRYQLFYNVHFKRNVSLNQKFLTIDKDFPTLAELNNIKCEAKKAMKWTVKEISKEFEDAESFDLMLTGSTCERLNIPLTVNYKASQVAGVMTNTHALLTDYDFMICDRMNQADFGRGEKYEIRNEDTPPGFAKINCNMSNTIVSPKEIKHKIYTFIMNMPEGQLPILVGEEISPYLVGEEKSPFLVGEEKSPFTVVLKVSRKGPAIRIKTHMHRSSFLVDITFSIKAKKWPTNSDWLTRTRKWPCSDFVEKIVQEGFHLVPKSHPKDKKETTWRFSFSKAEVTLLNEIQPTARICFVCLKIIVKDFLIPCSDKLSTYYFKSIFMHVLEKTEPSFWRENDIEDCFYWLFKHVSEAVKSKQCPHFWLNEINFFEELTDRDVNKLLKLLTKIKQNPSAYIDDSFVRDDKNEFNEHSPLLQNV
ncbi:cyclic GMP-AMP synthase-like receptor 2 isoform X2 [Clytia hemisphaerica]